MIIGIIGGKGNMATWLKGFLRKNNSFHSFDIIISDIMSKLSNRDVVEKSDIIVFSVPIGKTVSVIEDALKYTRKGQMLMDLTSIKEPVVKAMLKSDCEVLSIHPMFSHTIQDVRGQTVVMCKARIGAYTPMIEGMFIDCGANVKISTPEEHDRVMTVIQGLTHFELIVLGECFRKLGMDISKTLDFTSPIYKIRMDMVGRVLAQDPRLYAEIQVLNPYTMEALDVLMKSSEELFRIVQKKDVAGFINYFSNASEFLGEFREKAMKESNILIDRLAESNLKGASE